VITTNPEVVRPQREKLLAALRGRTEAVVPHLAEKSVEAVFVSYRHEFRIECKGQETVAGWRVVSGLFSDSEGEVDQTAQEMAWRDEKAVPWAGAAARISRLVDREDCPVPVVGRAYCSLPLPVETGLPVHLHGFFDLDSSRHALTTDGGQSGKDAIRVQWNQVLVRHAVSRAYAALIEKAVGDIGDKDPRAYYDLWPDGDRVLGKPFEELIKNTIDHVAPLSVVRAARAANWLPIGKVFVLPAAWSALQDPLASEGAALPDPPLPPHVLAGFQAAGVGIQTFRPQKLRDMLRTEEALGVAVENAPRSCLRRREWVALMLRFCLSDQSKDLKGLPLAILADGKLKTIGLDLNGPIFLAGREERELFAGNPEWFLDEAFAKECEVHAVAEAGLRTFTPADALLKLQGILSSKEVTLPWDPDGQDRPNASWLTRLYRYLAAERLKGFAPDEKVMAKIWMVPAEGRTLRQPTYVQTPLLPLEPVDGAFRVALKAFDLRVIQTDGDLLKAIQAFVDAGPDAFIYRLNGPNLVRFLNILSKQRLPEYKAEVHESLLDYLAQPRWKTQYGKDRLDELQKLRIYPTTGGARFL
jgi:sacsin